jgi:oligoribonuclease NrnB/cAMP/cGMP phosphodiesterase (DHH superfamily)
MDVGFRGTISFRANGKLDVSKLSKELFNGGGHKNASGGRILNFKDIYLYEDAKEIVEEILND